MTVFQGAVDATFAAFGIATVRPVAKPCDPLRRYS